MYYKQPSTKDFHRSGRNPQERRQLYESERQKEREELARMKADEALETYGISGYLVFPAGNLTKLFKMAIDSWFAY